jgi:hypothetical protein
MVVFTVPWWGPARRRDGLNVSLAVLANDAGVLFMRRELLHLSRADKERRPVSMRRGGEARLVN